MTDLLTYLFGNGRRGVLVVVLLGAAVAGVLGVPSLPGADSPGDCRVVANHSADVAAQFGDWHERNAGAARGVVDALPASAEAWNDYLQARLDDASTPNASGLHLVDLDSGEVLASTAGYTGRNVRKREVTGWGPAIRRVASLEGVRAVGYYRGMRGNPKVVYVAPAGQRRGLVYVVRMESFAADLPPRPGRVTYVLDARESSLRIVYDSTGEAFTQPYPGEYTDVIAGVQEARTNGTTGVAAARAAVGALKISAPENFSEASYVPGYAPVEGTPYVSVVHVPSSELGGATCGT